MVGDGDDGADPGASAEEVDAAPVGSRVRLREAARGMLAGASLDDLTEFVTLRRLTEATGLSSGAVYSAYRPDRAPGARGRSAPQNAARDAFGWQDLDLQGMVETALTILADQFGPDPTDGPAWLLSHLASLVAESIAASARGEDGDGWTYTRRWLGAAVGLGDDAAAAVIRDRLLDADRAYAAVLAHVVDATGRQLVEGVGVQDLAQMVVAVCDGCALRLRVDPDLAPAILERSLLSLFDAMTRRAGTRDDLPAHRLSIDGQAPLDETEEAAVRAAVRRVHERAGWPAVTLAKVGQLSGVADARIAGRYRSRHALAVLAWDEVVDDIERRFDAYASRPAGERFNALVQDVTDMACSQRALIASLLVDRLEPGSIDDDGGVDAATERLVEILAELFAELVTDGAEDKPLLGPLPDPDASTIDAYRRSARMMLDALFLRAATSRTSSEELAARVVAWMALAGVDIP